MGINNFFIWLFYEAFCSACCHSLNRVLVTIYQKIIHDTKYILALIVKSQAVQCSGYATYVAICKQHIFRTSGHTSQHLEQELAFRYAVTNKDEKERSVSINSFMLLYTWQQHLAKWLKCIQSFLFLRTFKTYLKYFWINRN